MFNNILLPISSEFYPKHILQKAIFLAEKFNSKLTLIYIIETKTLLQTDKATDSYRTQKEIEETKKEIINNQKETAAKIVFEYANHLLKNKNMSFEEKTVEGEYSDAIQRELDLNEYDLILMGFEKECLLNYRLLEDVNIPVWVETGRESKKILGVCSNLAPNQKVPDLSVKLSEIFDWELEMLYVVDVEDSVQVDEQGKRSEKKPERDLLFTGQKFVEEIEKKGIKAQLVKGSLEKETIKAAEKINANLIVVGREQKKKGMLGLPVKNIRKKIAEKCDYSILFIH